MIYKSLKLTDIFRKINEQIFVTVEKIKMCNARCNHIKTQQRLLVIEFICIQFFILIVTYH